MMSNSEARKRLAANEPSPDVEALADLIDSVPDPIIWHDGYHVASLDFARAILASDWLAAHTAAAEARGAERERERIAAEVEAAIPTTGIYSSDHRAIGALQSAVRIIRAGGAS